MDIRSQQQQQQGQEDRYEVIVRKVGEIDPVEMNVLMDRQIQEVLYLIGRLNSRNA